MASETPQIADAQRETARVLVVEDEPALVETLEYTLLRQGYDVRTATDGLQALAVARRERPDLIVLDVMLPKLDGLEVCRILRHEMSTPILMLTARVEEVDRVVGLEMGADDYLGKPFSMRELLARVKALLRRVRLTREETSARAHSTGAPTGRESPAAPVVVATRGLPNRSDTAEVLVFGDLVIDQARREARRGGEALRLTPKEYDLLLFLARHRGIVLSRDLVLERVWGWDFGGGSRTVDVHVRWLREKIETDAATPVRIVTVRGIGYRFEG